jgi:hypothetical protein
MHACEYERAARINDVLVSISECHHPALLRLVSSTPRDLPAPWQLSVTDGEDAEFEACLQQAIPIVLACMSGSEPNIEERLAVALRYTNAKLRTMCLLFWMGPTVLPLCFVRDGLLVTRNQQVVSVDDWTNVVRACRKARC